MQVSKEKAPAVQAGANENKPGDGGLRDSSLPNPHDAALDMRVASVAPLPAKSDHSKAPALSSWTQFQTVMPTEAQINTWYRNNPRWGVGAITGLVSGNLLMVEVEGRAIHLVPKLRDLATQKGITHLWDKLNKGWLEASPKGGLHWHLRSTSKDPVKTEHLARRPATDDELEAWKKEKRAKAEQETLDPKRREARLAAINKRSAAQLPQVLAETKGEGGFTITAPTPGTHHETGKPWTLLQGGPHNIPEFTEAELEQILDLFRAFDEMPEKPKPANEPPPKVERAESGYLSPNDDYEQNADWLTDVLPDWDFVKQVGEETYIRRPGKNTGHSATLNYENSGRLKVFTSSSEFEEGGSYSKYGARCHRDYGAITKETKRQTTKDLAAEGWGTPDPVMDLSSIPATSLGAEQETGNQEDPPEKPSWGSIDLQPILDAIAKGVDITPRPTIGQITGAGSLFYPQAVNGIYGPSGTGKTFIAVLLIKQEIEKGNHVLMIDFEAGPHLIVDRLLTLGADPALIAKHFYYVQPQDPFSAGGAKLITQMRKVQPTLAIIDSTGEALALEGKNPNHDDEVAQWQAQLPKRLSKAGMCVVLVDHEAKDQESARRGPGGTIRKQAGLEGVEYRLRQGKPFSRNQDGYATLTVTKDRPGNYTKGDTVAELHVKNSGAEITLEPGEGHFRPTDVMGRISDQLTKAGGTFQGFNKLATLVVGKHATIQAALAVLTSEGYIRQTTGDNRAKIYTQLKPFPPKKIVNDLALGPGGSPSKGEPPGNHLGTSSKQVGTTREPLETIPANPGKPTREPPGTTGNYEHENEGENKQVVPATWEPPETPKTAPCPKGHGPVNFPPGYCQKEGCGATPDLFKDPSLYRDEARA